MRRPLAILALLCASLGALPAFAGGAADLPAISVALPVTVTCTGSNVNLRREPGKNGSVLTRLSKGQNVYAIDKKSTGEAFPWVRVITDEGYKGWFYGQYCKFEAKDLSKEARFKAAFNSSVFFDVLPLQRLTGHYGYRDSFKESELKRGLGGYAEYKIKMPELILFCLHSGDDDDSTELKDGLIAAKVISDKYCAAGLRIGDSFFKKDAEKLSKYIRKLERPKDRTRGGVKEWEAGEGWDGPSQFDDESYWWFMRETVDKSRRPVQGFTVGCKNGKITDIWWCTYAVD